MPEGGRIFLLNFGINPCSNPNFVASLSRVSACGTWRNSADKATSPKNTARAGRGFALTEDTSAAATARSAAGSAIRKPPATFKKISRPDNGTPHLASRTAVSIASRPESQPTTFRRGLAREEGATSASISTSRGRVPSSPANTAVPATLCWRSPKNNSEGFGTCCSPCSDISKTPISSVAPKRFFTPRKMRK